MMPKIIALSIGLAGVLTACSSEPNPDDQRPVYQDRLEPGVAARVNDEVITWAEVESQTAHLKRDQVSSELRQAVLRDLVEVRLILQSAERNSISVSEQEVDELLRRRIGESAPIPDGSCEGCLRKGSVTEFREELRFQLLSSKVFQHYCRTGTLKDEPLSEDRARSYFEDHRDQFAGDFGLNRLKLHHCLEGQKRLDDHENLVAVLFQQAQITPKSLTLAER